MMLRTLAVSSITWLLVFGSRAVDGSWSLSRRMHCFVDILLRWAIVYFFFVGVLHCVFYRLGSETWLLPTFLDRIGWSYIGHTWTMEWVIGWTRQEYIYGGQLVADSAAERHLAAKKGPCP